VNEEVVQLSALRLGRQYEIEAAGYCPAEDNQEPEWLYYYDSVYWVVNNQPEGYNPAEPWLGLAGFLFDGVKRELPKRLRSRLRLYISVGSSLDYWHGVDLFFVLWDEIDYFISIFSPKGGRKSTRATIDLIRIVDKDFKADFRITPVDLCPQRMFIREGLYGEIAQKLLRPKKSWSTNPVWWHI
jgi:hypothetical protein